MSPDENQGVPPTHAKAIWKGRILLDAAVATVVLLATGWLFEHFAGKAEIEDAIKFQDRVYSGVNKLQPFRLLRLFLGHESNHHGGDVVSRIIGALWETLQDVLADPNPLVGWSLAITLVGVVVGHAILFVKTRDRSLSSWHTYNGFFASLGFAPITIGIIFLLLKLMMLVFLLAFGWITRLAGLISGIPLLYMALFRNIDRSFTERLIEIAQGLARKVFEKRRSTV